MAQFRVGGFPPAAKGAELLEARSGPVNGGPAGTKQTPTGVPPLYFATPRGSNNAMPVRFRTRLSDAWRLIAHSLSGRLLLLTLLYVMVSEVAIFVPSIGRFYVDQLS